MPRYEARQEGHLDRFDQGGVSRTTVTALWGGLLLPTESASPPSRPLNGRLRRRPAAPDAVRVRDLKALHSNVFN